MVRFLVRPFSPLIEGRGGKAGTYNGGKTSVHPFYMWSEKLTTYHPTLTFQLSYASIGSQIAWTEVQAIQP